MFVVNYKDKNRLTKASLFLSFYFWQKRKDEEKFLASSSYILTCR